MVLFFVHHQFNNWHRTLGGWLYDYQACVLEFISINYYTSLMDRKPRLHIPGSLYHVMLRGNGGDNIFLDNEDRFNFYLLLQEGITRFGNRIHWLTVDWLLSQLLKDVFTSPSEAVLLLCSHFRNWRRILILKNSFCKKFLNVGKNQ